MKLHTMKETLDTFSVLATNCLPRRAFLNKRNIHASFSASQILLNSVAVTWVLFPASPE